MSKESWHKLMCRVLQSIAAFRGKLWLPKASAGYKWLVKDWAFHSRRVARVGTLELQEVSNG